MTATIATSSSQANQINIDEILRGVPNVPLENLSGLMSTLFTRESRSDGPLIYGNLPIRAIAALTREQTWYFVQHAEDCPELGNCLDTFFDLGIGLYRNSTDHHILELRPENPGHVLKFFGKLAACEGELPLCVVAAAEKLSNSLAQARGEFNRGDEKYAGSESCMSGLAELTTAFLRLGITRLVSLSERAFTTWRTECAYALVRLLIENRPDEAKPLLRAFMVRQMGQMCSLFKTDHGHVQNLYLTRRLYCFLAISNLCVSEQEMPWDNLVTEMVDAHLLGVDSRQESPLQSFERFLRNWKNANPDLPIPAQSALLRCFTDANLARAVFDEHETPSLFGEWAIANVLPEVHELIVLDGEQVMKLRNAPHYDHRVAELYLVGEKLNADNPRCAQFAAYLVSRLKEVFRQRDTLCGSISEEQWKKLVFRYARKFAVYVVKHEYEMCDRQHTEKTTAKLWAELFESLTAEAAKPQLLRLVDCLAGQSGNLQLLPGYYLITHYGPKRMAEYADLVLNTANDQEDLIIQALRVRALSYMFPTIAVTDPLAVRAVAYAKACCPNMSQAGISLKMVEAQRYFCDAFLAANAEGTPESEYAAEFLAELAFFVAPTQCAFGTELKISFSLDVITPKILLKAHQKGRLPTNSPNGSQWLWKYIGESLDKTPKGMQLAGINQLPIAELLASPQSEVRLMTLKVARAAAIAYGHDILGAQVYRLIDDADTTISALACEHLVTYYTSCNSPEVRAAVLTTVAEGLSDGKEVYRPLMVTLSSQTKYLPLEISVNSWRQSALESLLSTVKHGADIKYWEANGTMQSLFALCNYDADVLFSHLAKLGDDAESYVKSASQFVTSQRVPDANRLTRAQVLLLLTRQFVSSQK